MFKCLSQVRWVDSRYRSEPGRPGWLGFSLTCLTFTLHLGNQVRQVNYGRPALQVQCTCIVAFCVNKGILVQLHTCIYMNISVVQYYGRSTVSKLHVCLPLCEVAVSVCNTSLTWTLVGDKISSCMV